MTRFPQSETVTVRLANGVTIECRPEQVQQIREAAPDSPVPFGVPLGFVQPAPTSPWQVTFHAVGSQGRATVLPSPSIGVDVLAWHSATGVARPSPTIGGAQ